MLQVLFVGDAASHLVPLIDRFGWTPIHFNAAGPRIQTPKWTTIGKLLDLSDLRVF